MNKKFWKNKKVLITGFEGFLVSNLTKAIVPSGAKIFGLDIKVGRRDTLLTTADYKKITVIKGSVANYKLLKDVIIKNKINVVFHLAAEAIVGKCKLNPLDTFSTNIKGTWMVLEACRNSNAVKSIIIASSDKAYGTHKKLPYKEDTSLKMLRAKYAAEYSGRPTQEYQVYVLQKTAPRDMPRKNPQWRQESCRRLANRYE